MVRKQNTENPRPRPRLLASKGNVCCLDMRHQTKALLSFSLPPITHLPPLWGPWWTRMVASSCCGQDVVHDNLVVAPIAGLCLQAVPRLQVLFGVIDHLLMFYFVYWCWRWSWSPGVHLIAWGKNDTFNLFAVILKTKQSSQLICCLKRTAANLKANIGLFLTEVETPWYLE